MASGRTMGSIVCFLLLGLISQGALALHGAKSYTVAMHPAQAIGPNTPVGQNTNMGDTLYEQETGDSEDKDMSEMLKFLHEYEGNDEDFWFHTMDKFGSLFLEEDLDVGKSVTLHHRDEGDEEMLNEMCSCEAIPEEGLTKSPGRVHAKVAIPDEKGWAIPLMPGDPGYMSQDEIQALLQTEVQTHRYGHYRGGSRDYYAVGGLDNEEELNSGTNWDYQEIMLYSSRNRRSHEDRVSWSCHINQPNWQDLCEGIVFFEVDHESILLMNFNGHVHSEAGGSNAWLYMTFFVDDVEHPMPGSADWGQYHIYREINEEYWAPCSWFQQYRVGRGKHEVLPKGRVNYGHMVINGWAFQVSVIPR